MRKEKRLRKVLLLPAAVFILMLGIVMNVSAHEWDLIQVGMQKNAITVSWEELFREFEREDGHRPNVTGYQVYAGDDYSSARLVEDLPASAATSYTLNVRPGEKKYIAVHWDYLSNDGTVYHDYAVIYDAKTLPTRVTGVGTEGDSWFSGVENCILRWNDVRSADEYEYQILKGSKMIKKGVSKTYGNKPSGKSYWTEWVSGLKTNKVYAVRVRACTTFEEKKYYGAWSDKTYLIAKPELAKCALKNKKLTVSWKKISGVTGYDIYVSTKPKTGFKKAKSVSASAKSCTIKKLSGKKLNRKKYYVYIVAKKKAGKKTWKSRKSFIWTAAS